MPVTIEIYSAAKTVVSTYTGEVGEDDLRFARKELRSRPDFDPTFSHVVDFHAITAANVSTQFLRDFARGSIFRREAKQIVVAPQPHIFALARMTQILMEAQRPNIQVVRSLDEAYVALGIKHPAGAQGLR